MNTNTLKEVGNKYYLNGNEIDYMTGATYNNDGKMRLICYCPYIDKRNRLVKLWIFDCK